MGARTPFNKKLAHQYCATKSTIKKNVEVKWNGVAKPLMAIAIEQWIDDRKIIVDNSIIQCVVVVVLLSIFNGLNVDSLQRHSKWIQT